MNNQTNNQMNNYQYNKQYNQLNGQQMTSQKVAVSKMTDQKMDKDAKIKIAISIIGLAIVLVAIVGISFAVYEKTIITGESGISTGAVTVSFTESNNSINIKNAVPVTDETGKKLEDNSFNFAVTTTSEKSDVPYTISVMTSEGNTLDDSYVKIYLLKENEEVVTPSFISDLSTYSNRSNSKILYSTKDSFTGEESEKITHYTLKLWLDKDFDIGSNSEKNYKLKVNVDTLMPNE